MPHQERVATCQEARQHAGLALRTGRSPARPGNPVQREEWNLLPDNLFGALLMSVINMSICFLVLGFLALVIRITARAVAASSVSGEPGDSGKTRTGDSVPSEGLPVVSLRTEDTSVLTPEEKAAVVAALAVMMTGSGRRIRPFVRGIRDSGAWGRVYRTRMPQG